MNTPTPGDLSARLRGADVLHMRMLSEMARPVPGSPEGVAWLAAEAYREVAHAAIAALSALPAAGGAWQPITSVPRDGTRVVVWMPDGTFSSASYSVHSEPQGVYWMIPTTPQPSAAEPKCVRDAEIAAAFRIERDALAGLTPMPSALAFAIGVEYRAADIARTAPPPDAAVGAQGDGDDRALIDAAIKMLRADGFVRSADAIHRLATPAAGKGVDDAMVERFCAAFFTPKWPTSSTHNDNVLRGMVRPALEAALTRQPVAGDGWRPIESAPKDGTLVRLLIAADDAREHPLDDSAEATQTIGHNNFDNDGEDRWQFAGWCWCHDHYVEGHGNPIAWAPLPALTAPAATPTDGGEGK